MKGIRLPLSKREEERFWTSADVSGQYDCWIWRDRRNRYGLFCVDGELYPAHRVAWSLAYRQDPAGWVVLHSCDVAGCVNPRHLRLGTQVDNSLDIAVYPYVQSVLSRAARPCSRATKAERAAKANAGRAEVHPGLIAKVKISYANSGDVTATARELGVATSVVFDILTGRAVPAVSA